MAQAKSKNVADYIVPLHMNRLNGRMLYLPPPRNKKRQILFVYGHHSSLERWWGLVKDLNKYGGVTMPDLPGFGGMESFYKIGEKPTLDNLADYLAAFVKMRYKRKKVTIAGLSFGFVIATRMLQRCPELADKVELLVSVVGFAHKDDFAFSRSRYLFYRYGAAFFSRRLPALFFRNVCLHPLVIRLAYSRTHNARQKFATVSAEQFREVMDFEIQLWRTNDIRTHMKTSVEFLTLDNCRKPVKLPLWHISVKADRYFDNHAVIQHLKIIFDDVEEIQSNMDNHAPSVIADEKTAAPLIPRKLRSLLRQQ